MAFSVRRGGRFAVLSGGRFKAVRRQRPRGRWSRCATPLLVGACLFGGCRDRQRGLAASDDRDHSSFRQDVRIYEGVSRVFALADYYKPDDESADAWTVQMSPLIVQEVVAGAGTPRLIGVGPGGQLDAEPPCVFYTAANRGDQSGPRELVFCWCMAREDGGSLMWRGVRMVLGRDGSPEIWEFLAAPALEPRILFVSEEAEERSRTAFGPPLEGRRFSVEPAADHRPPLMVARAIAEGPVPMGPYVYLANPAASIVTIACRCMPSQAAEYARTVTYRLCPAYEAPAAIPSALKTALSVDRGHPSEGDPERVLRISR